MPTPFILTFVLLLSLTGHAAHAEATGSNTAASPAALRGDPQQGEAMAKLCTSCHGHQGRSVTSRYPSIAGLDEAHIVERLKAFQAGESGHLMASMTRGLSDQDIAHLAAYYAGLSPRAWPSTNPAPAAND